MNRATNGADPNRVADKIKGTAPAVQYSLIGILMGQFSENARSRFAVRIHMQISTKVN